MKEMSNEKTMTDNVLVRELRCWSVLPLGIGTNQAMFHDVARMAANRLEQLTAAPAIPGETEGKRGGWDQGGAPTAEQRKADIEQFRAWCNSRENPDAMPGRGYVWSAACAYARRSMPAPAPLPVAGDKLREAVEEAFRSEWEYAEIALSNYSTDRVVTAILTAITPLLAPALSHGQERLKHMAVDFKIIAVNFRKAQREIEAGGPPGRRSWLDAPIEIAEQYAQQAGEDVRDGHSPDCDFVSDNPEGVIKPCNCRESAPAQQEGELEALRKCYRRDYGYDFNINYKYDRL